MTRLNCLITAGPTREYLDPVRYISNASSGKMGYALATEAASRGWDVVLISGPVEREAPAGVRVIPVISAQDMCLETKKRFALCDIAIGAAAVADWRPLRFSRSKLKKTGSPPAIRLTANPDILEELGKIKQNQLMVGFALETNNLISSARAKLKRKNLDIIVANKPSAIGKNSSQAVIIDSLGKTTIVRGSKSLIAKRILDAVYQKARHI